MEERPRSRSRAATLLGLILCGPALAPIASFAQVSVLTYHNDNSRAGLVQETTLTHGNVNHTQFRRLFSHRVRGQVYAQPLYVPNVSIPGKGTHNVFYVATEHDIVYAFDADSRTGSNSAALWKTSFVDRRLRVGPVPSRDTGCEDLVPEVGITSTPVIDSSTGTLYVVAKTKEHAIYKQRLHALDITTGQEKFGGPVEITASVPGTGDGSDGMNVSFDPLRHNQRAGLLLANGMVYIAWASHCDNGPYHGWVMAYDAGTLQQTAVFNATPNGGLGGIWQSGAGLAVDADGNIYCSTGNGTFDADTGGSDYGDTVLKLSSTLGVLDYFTPFNQADLESADADLGSSGTLVLPDQPGSPSHLLVTCGKEGKVYLLDRDSMGHFHTADDSQIVQSIADATNGAFDMPALWDNHVYYQAEGDTLKAFQLSGGLLSGSPVTESTEAFNFPGATPSISANGLSDAIVWVIERDTSTKKMPAVLHAYDATDLTVELYSSRQVPRRDSVGGAVKFTVPTVANGKVYVGARSRVSVYGLHTP